ncbi:hypothetical protein BHE74_00019543 [Ensete ventricosum]|nr:hypothetical protein GW17_00008230 [Ensete ventricosum]RWW72687.1 hypothetical protein BHE74_00019543 [Ensete ventricosum]RZR98402.1 hypothetical protein BHM03_00027753 [Ensete ventricosum]
MGGTYRSARLPVRGPPTTGRFRQKSTVGDRLSEKSTIGGRLRKKRGRRRGKEKKKKRGRKNTSPAPSSPACRRCPRPLFLPREETKRLPARGDRSRRPNLGDGCSHLPMGTKRERVGVVVYLRVVPGADEKGEVDGGGTPEAGNDSISLFQDRGGVCGERGCHSWM